MSAICQSQRYISVLLLDIKCIRYSNANPPTLAAAQWSTEDQAGLWSRDSAAGAHTWTMGYTLKILFVGRTQALVFAKLITGLLKRRGERVWKDGLAGRLSSDLCTCYKPASCAPQLQGGRRQEDYWDLLDSTLAEKT